MDDSNGDAVLALAWSFLDLPSKTAVVSAVYDRPVLRHRLLGLPLTISIEFALKNGDRSALAQVYPWEAERLLSQFTCVDVVVDTGLLHVVFAYIRLRFLGIYARYAHHIHSVSVTPAWPARLDQEPFACKLASLVGIAPEHQAQFLNTTELPQLTRLTFTEWAPQVTADAPGLQHLRRLELRDVANHLSLHLPSSLEEIVVVNSPLTITNTEPLPKVRRVTWHQPDVGQLLRLCPNVTWLDTTDDCPMHTQTLVDKITHLAINMPGTVPLEKFTKLAHLRLYGGSSYVRFMPPSVCHQLRSLHLGCSPQEVLIFEHLLLQFVNLERLVVNGFGLYFSPQSVSHDNLQKLAFINCCFIEGRLRAKCSALQEFCVSSTKSMVENFIDMDQFCNLRKLTFADSDWGPQFVWSHPKVVDLSLQNMELHYGAFDGFPELRRLRLDDNCLTSVQLTNPHLEEVSLSDNEMLKTVILMSPNIEKVDILGISEEASVFMRAQPKQLINGPLANLSVSASKRWELPPVPALILDLTSSDPVDEIIASHRTLQVNIDLPEEWKETCTVYLSPYTHSMVTNVIPMDFANFTYLTVVNLLTPDWGDSIELPPSIRKLSIHDPRRKVVPQLLWSSPADLEYLHLGRMKWSWQLIGSKYLPQLVMIRAHMGPSDTGPVPKGFIGYTWDSATVSLP